MADRRESGLGRGDFVGADVPALPVFENGEPVEVYARHVRDGYETISGDLSTR